MPTYEYECDACDYKFEEFQSITAQALKKCPACKKKKLRRLLGTGAAFIFKGSGFYQTDYRSEAYKKAAKADKDAAKGEKGDKSEKSSKSGDTSSKSSESGSKDSSSSKSKKNE